MNECVRLFPNDFSFTLNFVDAVDDVLVMHVIVQIVCFSSLWMSSCNYRYKIKAHDRFGQFHNFMFDRSFCWCGFDDFQNFFLERVPGPNIKLLLTSSHCLQYHFCSSVDPIFNSPFFYISTSLIPHICCSLCYAHEKRIINFCVTSVLIYITWGIITW